MCIAGEAELRSSCLVCQHVYLLPIEMRFSVMSNCPHHETSTDLAMPAWLWVPPRWREQFRMSLNKWWAWKCRYDLRQASYCYLPLIYMKQPAPSQRVSAGFSMTGGSFVGWVCMYFYSEPFKKFWSKSWLSLTRPFLRRSCLFSLANWAIWRRGLLAILPELPASTCSSKTNVSRLGRWNTCLFPSHYIKMRHFLISFLCPHIPTNLQNCSVDLGHSLTFDKFSFIGQFCLFLWVLPISPIQVLTRLDPA